MPPTCIGAGILEWSRENSSTVKISTHRLLVAIGQDILPILSPTTPPARPHRAAYPPRAAVYVVTPLPHPQ